MKLLEKIIIVALCTVNYITVNSLVTHHTWSDNLVATIKADTETNQMLLLYENNVSNSGIYPFSSSPY